MATQNETSDLHAFLQDVHDSARAATGGAAAADAADAGSMAETAGGVAVSGITRTISVAINNGQGEQTTGKLPTFFVTVNGTGTITAPAAGTWNITVTDLEAGKMVFQSSGLAANQPVSFSYRTGFQTQLQAVAHWSEGGSTTLELLLDLNL